MTDHEFVCHECGRTFTGLTTRIGEEMCPACGSSDIDFVSAPSAEPDTPDYGHDSPEAGATPTVG
jgi:transposase-like protein